MCRTRPDRTEPCRGETSNSIFALQLQMMAINSALLAEDKGLGSAWMPPVWLSHWLLACLPGCLPGQTEVIINARHARLFRDLCVRKIRDRVANNVNGDGIQNDARHGTSSSRECRAYAMDYAMRQQHQHLLAGRNCVGTGQNRWLTISHNCPLACSSPPAAT